ncbi:hypothetical protein [Bosea vaviloviae]|uniref:hypothetical protein n=1 Tax=Bosea vaviloviae TaxID=1526658 RepID=UPI001FCD6419|nr:hypothetical protein [Bosea vaviloviae]
MSDTDPVEGEAVGAMLPVVSTSRGTIAAEAETMGCDRTAGASEAVCSGVLTWKPASSGALRPKVVGAGPSLNSEFRRLL